jgi:hypothetical protein
LDYFLAPSSGGIGQKQSEVLSLSDSQPDQESGTGMTGDAWSGLSAAAMNGLESGSLVGE